MNAFEQHGNPLGDIRAAIEWVKADCGLSPRPPVFMSAENAEELYRQIREVQGERDRFKELLVELLADYDKMLADLQKSFGAAVQESATHKKLRAALKAVGA